MQIVRKNFTLKVLAVTLAVVGWAYIRFAASPVVAARFNQELSVPITAVNVPMGLVARYSESTASVTIATKRGQAPVNPSSVKAVLDLAGRSAGVYNVPVEVVAPDVAIASLSPASVTLTLERIAQRTLPVVLHYAGSRQPVVVSGSSLAPQSVNVSGTSGAVSEIAEVRAQVVIPAAPRVVDEMARPVPVDANGREVEDVQVAPDLVRVHVTFIAPGQPR
ncbi:MAG: CdaR family protein [Candidatus Tyrphobacter sp.]